MTDYSLVYPIDIQEQSVLLGKKRTRGKWQGKFNGFGGRRETGESFEQSAIRHLNRAELHYTESVLVHRANLIFEHQQDAWGPNIVRVFTAPWQHYGEGNANWGADNTPKTTDEIGYKAFQTYEMPYHDMPPDDHHWLPYLLSTPYRISARFTYRNTPVLTDHLHIITFDKPQEI